MSEEIEDAILTEEFISKLPVATTLLKKLQAIQTVLLGLKKDKSTKTQYNPNGYEYVTGAKILSHAKPLMNHYGLLLEQHVDFFDNTRMDYTTKNGTKSEILTKVSMTMVWVCTDTGHERRIPWGANGQNDWEKGFGSALTYAERYFLLKYFHISTDEDDIDNPDRKGEAGNTNTGASKTQPPVPNKPSGVSTQQKKATTPPVKTAPTQIPKVVPPPIVPPAPNKPDEVTQEPTASSIKPSESFSEAPAPPPAEEKKPDPVVKKDPPVKKTQAPGTLPVLSDEERKAKGKAAFATLDQPAVIAFLVKTKGMTQATVDDWIDEAPNANIVLAAYNEFRLPPKS